LIGLFSQVIRWPSPNRQRQIAGNIEQICHLPGVVGFIDGTHVRISAALKGDRDYYNRKGFPSVQLQVKTKINVHWISILWCQ